MIKRQDGFTMVELLITMVIFVFTIAAASSIFVPLLTQFKQQSKIAETQIEGAVGLDLLRRDLEQAGFGLPWVIPDLLLYNEATGASAAYNELAPGGTSNPPRAIVAIAAGQDTGFNGSDYLVIKATSVATNDAVMKWAYVVEETAGSTVKTWGKSVEDLNATDRAIVMIPSRGTNNQRILVDNAGVFSVEFQDIPNSAFSPGILNDLYLIYGVDPDTDLRMPFNRAEYYIRGAGGGFTPPPRCAPGTGVLMKSLINQADGARGNGMPLLDCVADMQMVYQLDRDGNGEIDAATSMLTDTTGAVLTARQIREQLKAVRVYILAHEGQKDNTYNAATIYPAGTVDLPEVGINDPGEGIGSTFNFATRGVTDWQRYRWKIYRIVVKPNNLRG
jgi:prepilin-type N-terminal cleavage/methylation domain-containing protein